MEKCIKKVVITGGPGGGKTTALDLFQREFGCKVSVVPESATVLFKSGVKRDMGADKVKLLQKAIYETQLNLEGVYRCLYPDRLLVCDRGTLDGLAYWPEGGDGFFETINSSYEKELERYDEVIFFQSGAASSHDMQSNNPYRMESAKEALELDKKLLDIWKKHPKFHFVPSNHSFMKKINIGILMLNKALFGKDGF